MFIGRIYFQYVGYFLRSEINTVSHCYLKVNYFRMDYTKNPPWDEVFAFATMGKITIRS
jgi:hypothetical protein